MHSNDILNGQEVSKTVSKKEMYAAPAEINITDVVSVIAQLVEIADTYRTLEKQINKLQADVQQ